MDRPLMNWHIDELEKVVRERAYERATLGRIREELTYRKTERARRLLREVEALIAGEMPRPARPPRPDSPDDQIPLSKDLR